MLKFFLPCQISWLDDLRSLRICTKSRQVGMTHADAYGLKAASKPGHLVCAQGKSTFLVRRNERTSAHSL